MPDRLPPDERQRGLSYTARVWTWRLWGISNRRLEVLATACTLAVLVWSRFALLPNGPWEWDETLFARGLLRFDLPAHFPHPPGFPLWMALGWVMLRLVGDPLLGLQLLSAAASCLSLFPLAALGRRVAPPCVATTAALVVFFAPGVWIHAGRGFTDTASTFFVLWAAALAVWGLDGRRPTWFTLLLTAAFLIRPILLPPIGLVWLAGALAVRPRRRLVPGVALSATATAAAVVGLSLAQGSWAQFSSAFAAHATTHARNLVEHNPGGVLDLGIVKAFGGPWLTAGVAALSLIGVVVWARRVGRRAAAVWLAVVVITVAQLVWLQNRTFPRYAVPLVMAVAPLLAATAAVAAPPALAALALGAVGAAWALPGYPLLAEQHTRRLPGWEAVQFAVSTARATGLAVIVEPGLYPFLSYQEQLDARAGLPWRFRYDLAPSSPDWKELPPEPYLLLTDHPLHYAGPLYGGSRDFRRVSPELRPLTQGRFLRVEVEQNVPIPVSGWFLPEDAPDHRIFRWASPGAVLHLPPVPEGTAVALDIEPAPGPTPLQIEANGHLAAALASEGETTVWIEPRFLSARGPTRLTFARAEAYVPGGGDGRPLAARLWDAWAVGPRLPWGGALAGMDQLLRVRAEGLWRGERFGNGRGFWTMPVAHLRVPAGPGLLRLTVTAPRPTSPDLEVFARGRRLAGPLQMQPGTNHVSVRLTEADMTGDAVELELRSRPYCPARERGGSDRRELGIVLLAARFEPDRPIPGLAAFRTSKAE